MASQLPAPELPKPPPPIGSLGFPALVSLYGWTALYGVASLITGTLSIFVAYGPEWGVIWPIVISLSGLGAVVGIFATQWFRSPWLERVTTPIMIGALLSYSFSVLVRAGEPGHLDRYSYAMLPIAICIIAFFRLVEVLPHKKEK